MVGLVFLLVILIKTSSSQQCSKPIRSIKGSYLTGHLISNGSTDGLGDCLLDCTADPTGLNKGGLHLNREGNELLQKNFVNFLRSN